LSFAAGSSMAPVQLGEKLNHDVADRLLGFVI
jgi:hypothetical protein